MSDGATASPLRYFGAVDNKDGAFIQIQALQVVDHLPPKIEIDFRLSGHGSVQIALSYIEAISLARHIKQALETVSNAQ